MRTETKGERGTHTKWSIHSLQKIIFGEFIFFKRHMNKHTQDSAPNTALLLKFIVYTGTGRIRAHISTWSSNIPKYCSSGDVCPCGVGTCWNL